MNALAEQAERVDRVRLRHRKEDKMNTELEQVLPAQIENRSFEIITEELGDRIFVPGTEPIVKRCIHTSADFDYADNLAFSENVVEKGFERAQKRGVYCHGHSDGKGRDQ